MKGRQIVIPTVLKQQVLDQLHTNHMGIEKTKLLMHESIYWANINTDIKKHIKNCTTCLEFQQIQPKEKILHHDIPLRTWEVLGADVFHFINKNYLCIVDYHSKFPLIKRLEGLSTENLIATAKVIFAEYGIPCKLMSDTGTNFISDRFRKFCSSLNIEQAVLSAYHHQSNGQVEACIKFIKCTFKNVQFWWGYQHGSITDTHYPTGPRLTEPNNIIIQSTSIMTVIDRKPVGEDYDYKHHSRLIDRQHKNDNDASPMFAFIPIGSAVAVQWEDGGLWTHGTIVGTGGHNHIIITSVYGGVWLDFLCFPVCIFSNSSLNIELGWCLPFGWIRDLPGEGDRSLQWGGCLDMLMSVSSC